MTYAKLRFGGSSWVFLAGFGSAVLAIGLGGWLALNISGQDTVIWPARGQRRSPVNAPPWGYLEAQRIPLVNTEDIDLAANQLMAPPRWHFDCKPEQLVQYLMAADLRARERGILLNQQYWTVTTNGCEIAPPESVVYSLDPASRARIYAILARSEFNPAQRSPYRFAPDQFRHHLRAIGLASFEIARLEQLSYTNATSLCLADLGIAKKVLRERSFEEFMEMIYSTPAYNVRLHVPPKSDVAALAKYWGRGGREKQITPLLRSLANVPGGASINIVALLPEFARNRVYTFPDSWDDTEMARQDCVFTALNFFHPVADTNFLNPNYVQQRLLADYAPVPHGEPPLFGDLIQLVDGENRIFHMSVFLAEEFVFTKNGVSPTEPWTIMRLPDMLTLYFANRTEGNLLVMRRKDLPGDRQPIESRSSSAAQLAGLLR
jgi:hypothetical protein